ncbi:MAG: NAD-dependent protein deacetylase [Jatrophihabitantaceae bacterium]
MTVLADPVPALRELVHGGGAVVLSGAGLSTESGIPDYRGPSGARRRHQPMTYQSFVADAVARHRYWARSYLGWPKISAARPNAGHRAVATLQARGLLDGIITQNVDGLHQAAGARDVVELHGGLDRTLCLHCGSRAARRALDHRLRAVNADFHARLTQLNPDGDAEVGDDELGGFTMLACVSCGSGPLKPDVVFFGENVPRERVERSYHLVDGARLLLVLGSSLSVLSGLRLVRRAVAAGTPVVIVNQGTTRGDELASIRVDGALGTVLPSLL